MGDPTDTIYVRLLDEGVDVFRPVAARREATGTYLILDQDVPEGEAWEFPPGTSVRVERKVFQNGGDGLLAVAAT